MNSRKLAFIIPAVSFALCCSISNAQTDFDSLPRVSAPTAYGEVVSTGIAAGASTFRALAPPPGVSLNSLDFSFGVKLGASWHSNPARSDDDFESDAALTINPNIRYQNSLGRHDYELFYSAGSESFSEFDTEDTDFQYFGGAIQLDFSKILLGDFYASRTEGEEQRGASSSRNLDVAIPEDEFETTIFGGRVTLGRRTNILQIYLGLEKGEFDFVNNAQDIRDRESDTIDAGLFFNLGPKTALFLHARESDIDYLLSSPNLDSTETSITLGINWEANEAFSLTLEGGKLEKDFVDPAKAGFDGTTYLGKVSWTPTDRNNLTLYASRRTEETPIGVADFYVSDLWGVDYSHQLGEQTTLTAYYVVAENDFSNGRFDQVTDYGLAIGYSALRWFDIGFSWGVADRDSTDDTSDFEDEVYSIFLTLKPFWHEAE